MDKLIENAQLLARATREAAAGLGLELFAAAIAASVRDRDSRRRKAWIPA